MSERPVVLDVEDLVVELATPRGPVRLVDGVSLQVREGETLGVVGESGSGKSLLLKAIMGLVAPPISRHGRIVFAGDDLSKLKPAELRRYWGPEIALVLQNPMSCLNPVMKIGKQLSAAVVHHRGISRKESRGIALELLKSVGINDPARRLGQFPHQLSGGMRQRVAIAVALASNPRLLLADEPTTALDVTVQAQILDLLEEQQRLRAMALILVSHDLSVVAKHADEIAVMYAGQIVEHGKARDIFHSPRMPYTQLLLKSIPRIDTPSHTRLAVISGGPPDVSRMPAGCRFSARCPYYVDTCCDAPPPLVADAEEPGHLYRCCFSSEELAVKASSPS